MIGTSTSSQTRQLIASFTAIGVSAPKVVTDAADLSERISTGVRQLGSSAGLAEAVAHAIGTGSDPCADPEVQRILTSGSIGAVASEVERVANDDLVATLNANADQIVKAWTTPFDEAGSVLTEAHQILGNVPLEETDLIVRRGGDAAEAWGRAQRATATIDRIVVGWSALAALGHIPVNRHYLALRIADIDPDQWIGDNLTEQKVSPWQAVCAGYRLSLPTPREYQQRIHTIERARADRQAAVEQAAHDRASGRKEGTRPSKANEFRNQLTGQR